MFWFPSQELLQRSEKYRRFWEGAGLSVGFFFRMLPTPTLRCLLKLESALQAEKKALQSSSMLWSFETLG